MTKLVIFKVANSLLDRNTFAPSFENGRQMLVGLFLVSIDYSKNFQRLGPNGMDGMRLTFKDTHTQREDFEILSSPWNESGDAIES